MTLKGTKTANNLMHAFAGESQARNRFLYYASIAKKEGFVQIQKYFLRNKKSRKEHAKRLMKLMNKDLAGETLYTDGNFPVLLGTTAENLSSCCKEKTKNIQICIQVLLKQCVKKDLKILLQF